jgi:hypothetical protein
VDHCLQELDHRASHDQRGRARGHLEVLGAEPHEETGYQFLHRGYVLTSQTSFSRPYGTIPGGGLRDDTRLMLTRSDSADSGSQH